MKWLQEWYEIWWLCCIKAAFLCENSPVKIPLSGAMHVNLQNNHSLHRKGLREFHSWIPWEFLLSTSPVHGREVCLETVKAVLHSQLPAATSAHHQSSGFSLCWPELPSRSSMSRCFLQTSPAKRFLLDVQSYITLYPANQAICLVASQEGVVGKRWSCFSQSFSECDSVNPAGSSLSLGLAHWWSHGSRQEQTPRLGAHIAFSLAIAWTCSCCLCSFSWLPDLWGAFIPVCPVGFFLSAKEVGEGWEGVVMDRRHCEKEWRWAGGTSLTVTCMAEEKRTWDPCRNFLNPCPLVWNCRFSMRQRIKYSLIKGCF